VAQKFLDTRGNILIEFYRLSTYIYCLSEMFKMSFIQP